MFSEPDERRLGHSYVYMLVIFFLKSSVITEIPINRRLTANQLFGIVLRAQALPVEIHGYVVN